MARIARVVVRNIPHHVTQRGNRRQKTFFCEDDYQYYVELVSEYSQQSGTEYGVEPVCKQLPIAPSTYYEEKARETDPGRLPETPLLEKMEQ